MTGVIGSFTVVAESYTDGCDPGVSVASSPYLLPAFLSGARLIEERG